MRLTSREARRKNEILFWVKREEIFEILRRAKRGENFETHKSHRRLGFRMLYARSLGAPDTFTSREAWRKF